MQDSSTSAGGPNLAIIFRKPMPARRAALALAAALTSACGSNGVTGPPPPPPPPSSHVLVGAGDIAVCGSAGTQQTADMLDRIDGTVFTAGDNAYFQGSADNYRDCYDPTWGRHKTRTRPTPGNHEYESPGAFPYFTYFGSNAGPPGLGYYSFEAGAWHVVSLNSNVPAGPGSTQYDWLSEDLRVRNARCLAAIWHHPLFSSSNANAPSSVMRDVWRLLQQHSAELVITGHEHVYERFAPLDSTGRAAPDGVRQFIAGTGGAVLYSFVGPPAPGSEVRVSAWGVLKLTLNPENYSWEFQAVGGAVRDSGSASCR
jgi:calcineurin-like phosphoesterase family protein